MLFYSLYGWQQVPLAQGILVLVKNLPTKLLADIEMPTLCDCTPTTCNPVDVYFEVRVCLHIETSLCDNASSVCLAKLGFHCLHGQFCQELWRLCEASVTRELLIPGNTVIALYISSHKFASSTRRVQQE